MKTTIDMRWIMSIWLMLVVTFSFAQEEDKQPVGEMVYMEYQENGIDRALEKYRQAKNSEKDRYDWNEWELNRIGYTIMNEDGDMEAAEKVFRLNMEEYPEAANPQDSYGDYLLKTGNEEEARKYFEKSISIAEKSDREDERNGLLYESKSKLAKLDKKDKQLEFLQGNWEVEETGYNANEEAMKRQRNHKVSYDEDGSAMFIRYMDNQDQLDFMRIIAYDAIDDAFDVAHINPNNPLGIQTSQMKLKKLDDNKYEMMGSFKERSGKEVKMRHELIRNSDDNVNWIVYEQVENDQWEKVFSMNMKKD